MMAGTIRYKRCFIGVVLAGIVLLVGNPGRAAAEGLGLDARTMYDLYIGDGESLTVIKDVEIVGFREIKSVTFLVVRLDSFDIKRSEGLILFDSVRAILPSHKTVPIQVRPQYLNP